MGRFLSVKAQILLRYAAASVKPTPSILIPHRHRSSQATKPQLIEIELGSSPASPLSGDDYDMALKLFDDLIHRILVKKATPDWLPFVPGSSFWVPPRPSPSNVVDLIEKLTNDLTDEESLSLATLRGWPSSKFFIQENESAHGGDAGVEANSPEGTVKVKVLTISENVALSEDEEG